MGALIFAAILMATTRPATTATRAPARVVHTVDRTRFRRSGVRLNKVSDPTLSPSLMTGTKTWIEPVLRMDQIDSLPSAPSTVASVMSRAPAPVSASKPNLLDSSRA